MYNQIKSLYLNSKWAHNYFSPGLFKFCLLKNWNKRMEFSMAVKSKVFTYLVYICILWNGHRINQQYIIMHKMFFKVHYIWPHLTVSCIRHPCLVICEIRVLNIMYLHFALGQKKLKTWINLGRQFIRNFTNEFINIFATFLWKIMFLNCIF